MCRLWAEKLSQPSALRKSSSTSAKASKDVQLVAPITCNKNGIPFDPETPVRHLGSSAGEPAGPRAVFGVANSAGRGLIAEVLNAIAHRRTASRWWKPRSK